jgi:small nuclear ribonucleoprotein (snRNP)-like protein
MSSSLLDPLIGQTIVADLRSSFVCIGTLVGYDDQFYEMTDADLHDFRDSTATREVYVFDSARFGVRRNRARVLVLRDEVVALTRLDAILEA